MDIKKKTGASTAIGEHVEQVQKHFQKRFNLPENSIQGPFWDFLWKDGDSFSIGELNVTVMHTPGHTPADVSYYIKDDLIITGDSVDDLWESTQKILSLPKEPRVFVGHDYMPDG